MEEQCIVYTTIAFFILMLGHYLIKPLYVIDKDNNKDKNVSHRLNMVYSLMFASALGIFYMFVFIIKERYELNQLGKNDIQIEPPSFRQ